jgi:hypothetical protein
MNPSISRPVMLAATIDWPLWGRSSRYASASKSE